MLQYQLRVSVVNLLDHHAGTSIVSDICDLSKVSDIDPLTWGSMKNSFFITYFVSHIKSISVKISGKYIYRKN